MAKHPTVESTTFAAKVLPDDPAPGKDQLPSGAGRAVKKDPSDRTSTQRSQRLSAGIKANSGATVLLRLKHGAEVAQLDSLIERGVGKDRSDVLRKLIAEKANNLK